METGELIKTVEQESAIMARDPLNFKGIVEKYQPLIIINAAAFILLVVVSFLFPASPNSPGGRLIGSISVFSVAAGVLVYYLYMAAVKADKASLLGALIHVLIWGAIFLLWLFIRSYIQ